MNNDIIPLAGDYPLPAVAMDEKTALLALAIKNALRKARQAPAVAMDGRTSGRNAHRRLSCSRTEAKRKFWPLDLQQQEQQRKDDRERLIKALWSKK